MKNLRKTIDVLFFVYHGLIGVLIGILLFLFGHLVFPNNEMVKDLFDSIGSTFIVGSLFGLLYTNISRNLYYNDLRYLIEREESGFRRLFPRSTDPEFINEAASKIGGAKEILMYGIGINLLWDPDILTKLKSAAKAHRSRVTVLLADINSPYIQQRLTEEEDSPFPSTQGKEVITNLNNHLKRIETEVGNFNYFKVLLFTHYPTFALIIADDDVFCYPYGFKTLGTVSPVLHLRGFNSPQVRYYRNQVDLLLKHYLHKTGGEN
jgi:hypothetical protein